jgi:hypothetical protein
VSIVGLLTPVVAAPAAAAESTTGTPIVYSETYLRLIALFPAGWAPNGCELAVALSGGSGVCETIINPVYFYPDGSLGSHAWNVDPSSPTGWSIPNPCVGVTPFDYDTWSAYVDGTNYPELGIAIPALTDDQVECGIWAWGWWF